MIRTASRKTPLPLFFATAATLLVPGSGASADPAGPKIVAARSAEFAIGTAAVGAGRITQFSFGPDNRLYASTIDRGIVSFRYNESTGKLTDPQSAADVGGAGIAFHRPTGLMYVSSPGAIYRLSDRDGNGVWGKAGEIRVAIVQNLPVGDHMNDNLQIVGNTLYVGIGTRTMDGGTGPRTGGSTDDFGGTGMFGGGEGNTWGESAYNGTISQIRDLLVVPSTPNAAGLFDDTSRATIQSNDSPFTSTNPGKLTVHSAGTRNPYGLAVDLVGNLYFTNNYNRATTNGDGTAARGLYADAAGPDFRDDVHDQFFKAVEGADYGYRNENYRGRTPILTPGRRGHNPRRSITFDNLDSRSFWYLKPYDPANSAGLGPSSSTNGMAFSSHPSLNRALRGNAFAARWTGSVNSADGQTLRYADLVAIHPTNGTVRVIADGFVNPLAVVADENGHLLVSDFGTGSIHFVRVLGQRNRPEPVPDYPIHLPPVPVTAPPTRPVLIPPVPIFPAPNPPSPTAPAPIPPAPIFPVPNPPSPTAPAPIPPVPIFPVPNPPTPVAPAPIPPVPIFPAPIRPTPIPPRRPTPILDDPSRITNKREGASTAPRQAGRSVVGDGSGPVGRGRTP